VQRRITSATGDIKKAPRMGRKVRRRGILCARGELKVQGGIKGARGNKGCNVGVKGATGNKRCQGE
jgi:hypothetical protein